MCVACITLTVDSSLPPIGSARAAFIAVHHVAFCIRDEAYDVWNAHLTSLGLQASGQVERDNFRSIYCREPNGMLLELATDGPGFTADELRETLGQALSLPPFLEPRRAQIEAGLKPLEVSHDAQ